MASRLLLAMVLVFYLIAFVPAAAAEQSGTKSLCHDAESLALLQFKESLTIHCKQFNDSSAHPKVFTWELESNDCCKWLGVECHENSGHVVSLDLSNSCLLGSFTSNSSLFQLVHLKRLNLAENDFNNSLIPPGLRHLSRLTNLNLSAASFFGDIPLEILELSDLVSLDLSENDLGSLLPGLRCMVQNLTKLKDLHLGPTHISSTVPETLLNLSLTSLHLERCDLRGKFPIGIFYLPNIQSIDLGYNGLLSGSIPEFNQSSHLESLELSGTSFSGKLSNSIGNLKFLQHFGVGQCHFFGPIPSSFGNLVQIISLDLSSNRLGGEFPKEIFYLPNLQNLELSNNENLSGSLPEFNRTYPLEILDLNGISFFGKLPHSICNLTQLVTLNLAENSFHGSIPESISRLLNLHVLRLGSNYFNGTIEFDLFLKSKNLIALDLSYNEISFLTKPCKNATFPKLEELDLSLCHLREFPDFLRNQDQLWNLNLKQNEIHGQVPKWMWNVIKNVKGHINLSFNFLTGFDEFPIFSSSSTTIMLAFNSNKL